MNRRQAPVAFVEIPSEDKVSATLPPGAGFDDRACLEVGHIVGLFNYLTRLADGFGIEVDAATQAAAASGTPLSR